ncbi:MAG TPA: flagellar motor switch protein FliN [Pirellulales bacterium]|jgi:flagellar motor switch protein FliN/FliY|nr:flagellar motor switch protein FliN [Pirellulales bacterium]
MADGPELVGQDEVADLLKQAKGASSAPAASKPEAAAASGPMLGQGEIEALLKQNVGRAAPAESKAAAGGGLPLSSPPGTLPPQPAGSDPARAEAHGNIAAGDIDFLITQAEQALASINAPDKSEPPPGATPFRLIDFSGAPASTDNATLELIRDVELDLKIELGRTQMYLEDVLKLSKGAVVPLDKLAGDPVDVYVNGRLIARGEVLILNDNFCVRIAELVAGENPAPT